MEEKEIVRKSVPIPNKWLKELLDFLGIEEDRYLAWMLFPHECNSVLGFRFNEDQIKEMVRNIYHPTEKELKQEDEWEKKLAEKPDFSKMVFWKQAMVHYPLYWFVHGRWAIDPLSLGKMMANFHKISEDLKVPFDSLEVWEKYDEIFGGIPPTDALAVIEPIYCVSKNGMQERIIQPDNFEVTKEEKKEEKNE